MFRKNEGWVDRDVRVMVGMALLLIGAFVSIVGPVVQTVAAALGLVLLVTAAVGFCPLYMLFGINTCEVKSVKK